MKEWARISPEQIQLPSTHPQHLLHKISATPGNDESKGLGRNGLDALLALDFHHLVQARTKNIFREWMLREKKLSYLIRVRKSLMPWQKKSSFLNSGTLVSSLIRHLTKPTNKNHYMLLYRCTPLLSVFSLRCTWLLHSPSAWHFWTVAYYRTFLKHTHLQRIKIQQKAFCRISHFLWTLK